MTIKELTLRNLFDLVSRLVVNEKTVMLYLFYCLYGKENPTREVIQSRTGMTLSTIRRHDRLLVELGAISHGEKKGRGKGSEVQVHDVEKPTQPRVSLLIGILNIPSQKSIASMAIHKKYNIDILEEGEAGTGRFSSSLDIENDPDWKAAKVHLEKYFKPYELNVDILTKKNRFSRLVELLIDELIDFPGYCKWYHETKYPERGFNFGLFLYPSLASEYLNYSKHAERYLKTSSRMADNDSFKSGVESTKSFLKKLRYNDEE